MFKPLNTQVDQFWLQETTTYKWQKIWWTVFYNKKMSIPRPLVLLYGSETRVMTMETLTKIDSFHYKVPLFIKNKYT
jgi:hypothetical protein